MTMTVTFRFAQSKRCIVNARECFDKSFHLAFKVLPLSARDLRNIERIRQNRHKKWDLYGSDNALSRASN